MFDRPFTQGTSNPGPAQDPPNGAASPHDLEHEDTSIFSPVQLPPSLSLGDRDDSTFERHGDTWSCLYRFEGEPFLELGWNGMMWELTQFWEGRKTGTTHAPARLSLSGAFFLHSQYLSVEAAYDPYEKLFKERAEATTTLQYWLPTKDSSIIVGFPGGRIKGLVFAACPSVLETLQGRSDTLRADCGASLVLVKAERKFQFVMAKPPEQLAEQISAEISRAYELPAGKPRIVHMDINGTRIWRVQICQQANLAYLTFPMRGLLTLLDALRTWQLLPPRLPDTDGIELLAVYGALISDAADFVGQTSVFCYQPWLTDMPAFIGTFPALQQETQKAIAAQHRS